MKYLLDTNVISEVARIKPNPMVIDWIREASIGSLFLSALSLGEIRTGVECLDSGQRKNKLMAWLEKDVVIWFGSNILPIDQDVAERWGYMVAECGSKKNVDAIDSLIAATALAHNLVMVTRNVKDFNFPGLEVLNPFE